MPVSVSSQAYIFLCSVIGGMLIAFIYDIFRIKRKAIKTSSIIIYIEDLLFWIVVALVMFAVVYYSNEGEIRGFIIIGTLLGVILYILLLSKLVISTSMLIIRLVYKVLKTLWLILSYPFRVIINILRVPCKLLLKLFRKIFRGAKQVGRTRLSKFAMWGRILKNIRKKI